MLPTGTVTFLFTDIEGSTRLMEQQPALYREALRRHHGIIHDAVRTHLGAVFETIGDAVYAAFARPSAAAGAAIEAQTALAREPWDEAARIRVRMGLHTGEVELWGEHYFGPALYRCARLAALAHGGQVVLTSVTAELVGEVLPEGVSLRDLGEHQLRDLTRPVRVFQLTHHQLPAAFPPLRTLEHRPNNLPAQTTPFIGREREVDAVRHHFLRQPDVRLVTLVGPGGTGKTRLALQAAVDSLEDFPDGVFYVPLSRVSDPEMVTPAIAQTLGVREAPDKSVLDTLKAALAGKQLLLVLDNFEHVLGAAPVVAELLAACSRLKVLATSREALRLYGEREFPVPAMALPDVDRLPPAAELAQYEAVRLFVERASSVSPSFTLDDTNAAAVARICHRLDGLPLAIELAAARTRLLPPQAMLARLEQRLPLLTGGARNLPRRQQTLRNAIGWSYDLLAPAEQVLFRRLGVFVGGCTVEGAEGVVARTSPVPRGAGQAGADHESGEPGPGARIERAEVASVDVLDGLESLVAKSLLRRRDGEAAAPRFVMLQTIREFALEQLAAAGEADELQHAHSLYYAWLAEVAAPELRGRDQALWLARLHAERHNLRAALRWWLQRGEAEAGLQLGAALWLFWQLHGYISEGRDWLTRLLALPGAQERSAARAKALVGLGVLTWHQGEYAAAKALLEESVSICRALGDRRDLASALAWHGQVVQQDDPDEARRLIDEAFSLGAALGDKALMARTLSNLGEIARWQGDYAQAEALYKDSLPLAREIEHQTRISAILHNLGHVALRLGDAEQAALRFREALRISRVLGDRRGAAHCLAGLGGVAAATGDPVRSARLLGAAAAALAAIGATFDPADRAEFEQNAAAAAAQLGHDQYAALSAEGGTLAPDQAMELAMDLALEPLPAA